MRQILQTGLSRTATYVLHNQKCCLTCRHVAAQPQISLNKLHIRKDLFGSLAHQYTASVIKNKWSHLKGEQKLTQKRWMSKSHQPEDPKDLSLDNPRVQTYLKRLREDHSAALHGHDEAKSLVARNQASLMMLLDQVRTDEVKQNIKLFETCTWFLGCFNYLVIDWTIALISQSLVYPRTWPLKPTSLIYNFCGSPVT